MSSTALSRYRELLAGDQPRLLRAVTAGMTQAQAAEHLGVPVAALCRWETGAIPPRAGRLEAYVAWLDELTQRQGGRVELARPERRAAA